MHPPSVLVARRRITCGRASRLLLSDLSPRSSREVCNQGAGDFLVTYTRNARTAAVRPRVAVRGEHLRREATFRANAERIAAVRQWVCGAVNAP
jgi:hypothetical protein